MKAARNGRQQNSLTAEHAENGNLWTNGNREQSAVDKAAPFAEAESFSVTSVCSVVKSAVALAFLVSWW